MTILFPSLNHTESSQDSDYSSHPSNTYRSYYSNSDSSMGSGSTPSKGNRTPSMPENSLVGIMANALREDLTGHVYSDASVKTFVEVVWGMNPVTAQAILDHKFELDTAAFADYQRVSSKKKSRDSEPGFHEPFRRIARKLLKDVCDKYELDYSHLKTCLWDKKWDKTVKRLTTHGDKVNRKLVLLDIFIPYKEDGEMLDPDAAKEDDFDGNITWGEPRCVIEFKRIKGTNPIILELVTEETEGHTSESAQGSLPTTRDSDPQSSSQLPNCGEKPSKRPGNRSRVSSVSSAQGATQSGRSIVSNTSNASRKRATPPEDSSDRPSKKPRLEVSVADGQLAEYALKMFIPGTRHYSTGFLIDCFNVKIWYYDRTASIRTVEFRFDTPEGTSMLALALFALSQATMRQVGFNPDLYKFITLAAGEVIQQENIVSLERPACKIAESNVCFVFEEPTTDDKTTDECSMKKYVFPVQDVISPYNGIVGRGTFVASVLSGVVGEALSTCMRVLKISWQFSARVHEGTVILRLRKKIPHWKKHLPDPAFYTKMSSAELGLPRTQYQEQLRQRGFTDDLADTVSNRDLHVLVTDRYEQLWKCRSVDEFKRVFLDCVECHYHAYTTGGVLHRDISENNLMVHRPDESCDVKAESTDEKVTVLGVLNDFDMASLTDPDGSVPIGKSPQHHITGTLPFMARELLSTVPPPKVHLYRYDLESFFYLLIWAATHYRLDGDESRRVSTRRGSLLDKWKYSHSAMEAKDALYAGEFLKRFVDNRIEGWEEVWDDWIDPLLFMFKKGQDEADMARHKNRETAGFDFATCDGKITFQIFMKTIKETKRGLIPVTSS